MSGTSQAPGSTGAPLFSVVAGTTYVSTDGGITWSIFTAGGSTIHTAAPLSGDGSVGTPATIANGAITNAKLATPPQDPSAVAITGGSITGASVQGTPAVTLGQYFAAQKMDWNVTQKTNMLAAVPALTAYKEVPLNMVPLGQTAHAVQGDASVEGGGFSSAGSVFLTGSIFLNQAGGNWAMACRMSIAALSSGKNTQFGVSDTATGGANFSLFIGAVFASNTTQFIAQIFNGAAHTDILCGTFDANVHDWLVTDDGTTLKVFRDGTLAGSTATRANISSATPMEMYFVANGLSAAGVMRAAYAFVQ